ncbi:MAG: adenylate/guanylate cyclase domain-containing protein [Deltaproteobacteria bacterium]|nr:adenylate/guanylate cyclase domain-containing protein [Deltaproteobacteria bacterium]
MAFFRIESYCRRQLIPFFFPRGHLTRLKGAARGKPPFSHGIGIHSGKVLAGNSGSEEQSTYALIGNTVNVASRIQALTKELGCDILVSQETVERLEDSFQMDKQPPRMLKGYSRPVIVHRIL